MIFQVLYCTFDSSLSPLPSSISFPLLFLLILSLSSSLFFFFSYYFLRFFLLSLSPPFSSFSLLLLTASFFPSLPFSYHLLSSPLVFTSPLILFSSSFPFFLNCPDYLTRGFSWRSSRWFF